MRERISACVTAGNEEKSIARCLASLTWCDEIIVIDSFSTDRTVEISRRFTPRVYQHEWLGYIGQKNLVLKMAVCPWVLILDADEEVSSALQEEIRSALETDRGEYGGYQFPRQVFYLGRWIRHGEWYPDIKLRLFKRELGHAEGREPHDHIVVRGRIRRLRNPILHYTYEDVRDHIETMNRFSSITAIEKFKEGDHFSWGDFLFRPWWRFLKAYFFKGGWRDGTRGLLIAIISSFGVMIKYAKLWEQREMARSGPGLPAARAPSARVKGTS